MLSTQAVNANHSAPAASASAATILAENGRRVGFSITNGGSTDLYVLVDNTDTVPTVSTSAYTVKIAAAGYWECPFNFQGAVKGVWSGSPTGNAQITEFTN